MARIVFFVPEATGHQNAAMQLARRLEKNGHHISFLGQTPQARVSVEAAGYVFHPFAEDLFPYGLTNQHGYGTSFFDFIKRARRIKKDLIQTMEQRLNHVIQTARPDLFIMDTFLDTFAMTPGQLGVPVILLSTTLPLGREGQIPPITSSLGLPTSREERKQCRRAWQKELLSQNLLMRLVGQTQAMNRLAKKAGMDASRIKRDAMFFFELPLPTLVSCPQALDFPRPQDPSRQRFYIEPSVNTERVQEPLPKGIDPNKELVYCSMGTMSARSGATWDFIQRVCQSINQHPQLQLVVAAGQAEEGEPDRVQVLREKYPQVLALPYAPQIALLKRAKLAIIHGGLNSIQECIYYGVPMLVVPRGNDQFGNTARVVHHGLGIGGDLQKDDVNQIACNLTLLLNDQDMRRNIDRMSWDFRLLDRRSPGVRIIEAFLEIHNAARVDEGHEQKLDLEKTQKPSLYAAK